MREFARSKSLAAEEELVPSDLLQLAKRTLGELGLHTFILRNFAITLRCKSYYEDKLGVLYVY